MSTEFSIEEQANRFKLLGHPMRLEILDILRRNPECVCHLEAALHKPQPYISQQLRLLREGGVIVDNRDGLNVYYQLADEGVAALLDVALGPATEQPAERQTVPDCPCPKCSLPASAAIPFL